jgi:hypothetical protein
MCQYLKNFSLFFVQSSSKYAIVTFPACPNICEYGRSLPGVNFISIFTREWQKSCFSHRVLIFAHWALFLQLTADFVLFAQNVNEIDPQVAPEMSSINYQSYVIVCRRGQALLFAPSSVTKKV